MRERQAVILEKAIWRLTAQPASICGFADRGQLRPGGPYADIVAFDPDTVGAGETTRVWDVPGGAVRLLVMGNGIQHVWVNGEAIRSGGIDVPDSWPGLLLRR